MNRLYPEALRQRSPIKVRMNYFGYRICVDTSSFIEWCLFANGIYEASTIKILSRLVRPGDVVIELGANIGAHTLYLSQIVGHGHIHAFEPFPPAFVKLKQNIEHNQVSNVTLYQQAVADSVGTLRLFYDPVGSNQGVASAYASYFPESVEVVRETIDHTFDNLPILHLIKLDIQGSEYAALRGSEKILIKFKPLILFEYDYNALEAGITLEAMSSYLLNLGYTLYTIDDAGDLAPFDKNAETIMGLASHPSSGRVI